MLIRNNGTAPVTMNLRDGTSYLLQPGVATSVPDAATTMIDDSPVLIALFNAGTLTVTTDAGGAFSGFPTVVNATDSAVGKLLPVRAKVGAGGARTLVDETGQPLGGGGGRSTVARAVAKALHFSTARRVSLDSHELLALPPVWTTQAVFPGMSFRSTDGKTLWMLEFTDGGTGTSTVEPVRNVIAPYATVKMADGCVWAPFDAANYRITTNPGLYDASKNVITYTTAFGQTYNFSPVDASSVALTKRYEAGSTRSDTNPSGYVAARAARAAKIFNPGAWYDDIYTGSGQIQGVEVIAGVYNDKVLFQFPFSRFYTKAKSVAIGILSTGVGTAPKGNIFIDGVAVSFMSLNSHPSATGGQATLYQFNFLDERERCFEITNQPWPEVIFTSANQDIYRDSRREISILSFGDSTMAGAFPGPNGKSCNSWGSVVGWELGAGPGVMLGNGGIGYIYTPTSPYIQSGIKGYSFIERWYKNRPKLDTSQGAQAHNIILFDIVGWDTDKTNVTLFGAGLVAQSGHASDVFSIDSPTRRTAFSAFLADVIADQPAALLAFVMPRDNASTAGLDVNGNVVPDGAGTANGNVGLMAVLDDWFYAIDAVVPSTSRLIVNLADMQYNTNDRNAPTVFSYKEGSPHTTTWHHVQKGKYVAQQIVRSLTALI